MAEDPASDDDAGMASPPSSPEERLAAFASVVNHDLRNPLNVAQGRLELARETDDDEHLAVVARAHDRLAALLEASVAWARAGQPLDTVEPVRIAETARDAWERVPTGSTTAELEVLGDRNVRGEPERVEELFVQLLENAVDHGGDPVTVRVGTHPGGFYVADTGPGIPPEVRSRVFDPGYASDSSTPGFGLAIAAAIAHAHGWQVSVHGSDAGGARFDVDTQVSDPRADEESDG